MANAAMRCPWHCRQKGIQTRSFPKESIANSAPESSLSPAFPNTLLDPQIAENLWCTRCTGGPGTVLSTSRSNLTEASKNFMRQILSPFTLEETKTQVHPGGQDQSLSLSVNYAPRITQLCHFTTVSPRGPKPRTTLQAMSCPRTKSVLELTTAVRKVLPSSKAVTCQVVVEPNGPSHRVQCSGSPRLLSTAGRTVAQAVHGEVTLCHSFFFGG